MTYLQFHLVFLVPAITLLAFAQRTPIAGIRGRQALRFLALIAGIAFLYTVPWDNYLVYRGIWGYPPGRVLATIGYVPVEEYAFFLLQPILTGLLYFALRGRSWFDAPPRPVGAWKIVMVGVWTVVFFAGLACLAAPDRFLYLGLILSWAAFPLIGMTWVGMQAMWPERHRVIVSIAVSTVYLWVADRIAIDAGIWFIARTTRTGLEPLGLPLEEAVFFFVTNVLCAQGLAMLVGGARTSTLHHGTRPAFNAERSSPLQQADASFRDR